MRTFVSLVTAAIVGSIAFALPWLRFERLGSSAETALHLFLGYGIVILFLTITVGALLVAMAKALKIFHWWVCTGAGLLLGCMLGGVLTVRGIQPSDPVANPFGLTALTFSPLSRDSPGFAGAIPLSPADFVGSVALGAFVGGSIGASFYFFYAWRSRSNNRLERAREYHRR